jgi:NADPH:quinone reductase-like Zn-dependent oxidoreductase
MKNIFTRLHLIRNQNLHTGLPRSFHTLNMSTQKAVVHVSQGVSELRNDVPLPKLPAENWLIVKTKAVALNPTDWKNIDRSTAPGAIAGCDYAGVVEEVGKDVSNYKVGDRIAGFIRGGITTNCTSRRVIINMI